MKSKREQSADRRGATAVEFALCLPVLLGFVFGVLEFSRVMQLKHTARLAAFEGARAGVSLNATTSDVQTAVTRVLNAVSISNATTTIAPNPLTYTSTTIQVTVVLDPTQNAWLTWYVKSSNNITATITLQREVQAVSVP
jgi:Flp pilus assembly protein TadG